MTAVVAELFQGFNFAMSYAHTSYENSILYIVGRCSTDLHRTKIRQTSFEISNFRTNHAFHFTYQSGLVPCANGVFADTEGTLNPRPFP